MTAAPVLRIDVGTEIPSFTARDIQSKLAYLDELVLRGRVDGQTITLELRRAATSEEVETIRAKTERLVALMADGVFEPFLRVLEDKLDRAVPHKTDPMGELVAARQVVPEGPGFFTLGPLLTRVVEWAERRVRGIADAMGSEPWHFPALISPSYLQKVRYFANFPHSLSFVTHLREDLEVIEAFAREARADADGVQAGERSFGAPQAMLSPTVCHHLYNALAGATLDREMLVATALGSCFRYESSNMVSLERLWNFSMREIMFVGQPDLVTERLVELRGLLMPMLDEMGLAYKIESASDPFFVDTFRDQTAYQSAFELKFEVRALLPFKIDTIAVGSTNYHKDFFGRTLDIRTPDGKFAHTGCLGIGFERLAYAFVCQHGTDPAHWPEALRRA